MSIERVGVSAPGRWARASPRCRRKAGADVIVYEPTEELATAGTDAHHRSRSSAASARASSPKRDRDAALAQADVHHRPRRSVRPPAGHRGGRRGRGRQGQDLRRTRRAHHRSRRGARVEHVEHPDHENRCGDEESEPRARPALLQPGAGAAAGRTGQHARSPPTTAVGAHRAVRERGARQAGGALRRPVRVRRQCAAGAVPAVGHPDGRSRRRHRRGHRQGRRRRAVAPDGPAAAVRPRSGSTR